MLNYITHLTLGIILVITGVIFKLTLHSRSSIITGFTVLALAASLLTYNFVKTKSVIANIKRENIRAKEFFNKKLATSSTGSSKTTTNTISSTEPINLVSSEKELRTVSDVSTKSESKNEKIIISNILSESQALAAMSNELIESNRNYLIKMENGLGQVNMGQTYSYPGRPNISESELEDLRNTNKSSSNATADLGNASEIQLGNSESNLRKFEPVNISDLNQESLKLIKFDAKRKYKNIVISWNTEKERYSDYFAIERSTDGKNFNTIGKVNGAGDYKQRLLYMYLDRKPSAGTTWYRLHQYDLSGNDKVFAAMKTN